MSACYVRWNCLALCLMLAAANAGASEKGGALTTHFGTHYGGSQSLALEDARDVAVDAFGNAYVVGTTNASDFPVTTGAYSGAPGGGTDSFLLKFSKSGALIFASRFGGSAVDHAVSVSVDASGRAYVVGETLSTDFPLVNAMQGAPGGIQDGFLVVFEADGGSVLFSDYFGGSASDAILDITAASLSSICFCGTTRSNDLLITNAHQAERPSSAFDDGFVTCMDVLERYTKFSTYVGGSGGFTKVRAISFDPQGDLVVAGATEANNLPVTAGSFQSTFPGLPGMDAGFISRFQTNGNFTFGSYLGGQLGATSINAVAVAADGRIIVGGETGASDFPTMPLATFPGPVPSGFLTQFAAGGASLIRSNVILIDPVAPRQCVVNEVAVVPGEPVLAVGTATWGVNSTWFYHLRDGASALTIFNTLPSKTTGLGAAMDAGGSVYVAGQAGVPGLEHRLVNPVQTALVNNVDAFVFRESNTYIGPGEGEGEGEGAGCDEGCTVGESGECICPEGEGALEGEGTLDCVLPEGSTNVAALAMTGPSIGEPASFTASANGFFVFGGEGAAIAFNVVHDLDAPVTAYLFDGPPNPTRSNVLLEFLNSIDCGDASTSQVLLLADGCKLLAGELWLVLRSSDGMEIGSVLLPGTSLASCTGEGEGEAEPNEGEPSACAAVCPGTGVDMDGDGLDMACEGCLATSDMRADHDGDGMPDRFEAANGLNPLDPADAKRDKDGDGIFNLREYLIGSDPSDAGSPGAVRYVAPEGTDTPQGGTRANPWKTIRYALSRIGSVASSAPRLRVLPGVYPEDIALRPGVTVMGPPCDLDDPDFDLAQCAVLQGEVTGAAGSVLENMVLQQGATDAALLRMDGIAMRVTGVVFLGNGGRTGTGIQISGTSARAAVIEQSDFNGLASGIDIGDSIPVIRLNHFSAHANTYIRFRTTAINPASSAGLGTESDPNSGYNRFDAPGQGDLKDGAIVNERAESISMEANDWGTDDAGAIDALIAGPADFEPFLASGGAILAGALYVSVWNAVDQVPVQDASVFLQISPYAPVTLNIDGVYQFAAVQRGEFTVTVNADGFDPTVAFVEVEAGDIASVIVPLGGVVVPPECGCGAQPGGTGSNPGDIVVVALSLLVLWGARRHRTARGAVIHQDERGALGAC